jgi:2-dehydropantoate 2-reductase
MKFCVYGAGAIGGYLAVELALAGHEVCVVARGAHLKAIQESGLKLLIQGREKTVRLAAEDDPTSFGPQDFVMCALNGTSFARTCQQRIATDQGSLAAGTCRGDWHA